MIQFHLKVSKCDQFGSGTNVLLCPVAALTRYLGVRGDQPGAFFVDSAHKVITFVTELHWLTTTLASHSFCIGAATTAAAVGIEDSAIQMLGRWYSAAFLQYIRTPKERLAALSSTLAQAGSSC